MIKKVFKWLGILLLVLIIAAVALPIVFKDKIVQRVKDETNKNLNAKVDFGDFDISLIRSFPDLSVTMENLSVVGVNEFKGDTLISLKQLNIGLNLMSVIKGTQYDIREIILDEPNIFAQVLKDGKASWDITKPSTEPATTTKTSEPFKMKLKKFEIKNGDIIYDDATMDMRAILIGLNHTLKGDFSEEHFTLETQTNSASVNVTYGGIKYLSKVRADIKADLDADMVNSKYTFKQNEISLNDLKLMIDGFIAMPNETDMDMDLKFKAKETEFKNILSLVPGVYTKDFADVKTSGKLSLDAFAKGIYNEKRMPAFGAKLLVNNAMFKYPSLPKSVNNIYLDMKVNNKDGQPDNTVIDINKMHFEMAQNPVDITMHISTPVSDANINGAIKGKLDLTSVKDYIPLEADQKLSGTIISDVTLKGRMSAIEKEQYENFDARGQFIVMDMDYKSKDTPYGVIVRKCYMTFSPKFVDLTAFDAKLGKSDIQATGKLENFIAYMFTDSAVIKGAFNMTSNYMNVNELMAEDETTTATSGTAQKPAATDTATAGVVEVPSNIDFTMNAAIGTLIYDNMEMKNVSGGIKVKDSKVDMTNLKMNLLNGSMIVNGSYDTKDVKRPKVNFDLNVSDFDITQTYKTFNTVEKLAPVAKYCSGKFGTTLKFSSDLDEKMEVILTSISGYGKLLTKAVQLANFEPVNKVADAIKMEKYKRLDLNNVNISFLFKDGKVNVEPFDIKVGNSTINIMGSNAFDQTINYTMTFDVPRSEMGSAANSAVNGLLAKANTTGANLSLGERVKIDALITGTVTKPVVKVDLKGAATNVANDLKDQAKAELDKKKAELEAKARGEADKAKAEAEAKARGEADKAKAEAEAKAKAEADRLKKEAEEKARKEAQNKVKNIFGKPK